MTSIRWAALATTGVTFVLSLGLWLGFDPAVSTADAPQMATRLAWFGAVDIFYYVGVDGLNLLLMLLTTLLGPIIVLSSWTYIGKAHKGYYALMLLLETGVLGVFAAFDVFLFYVFFEITLIPMVFIIGIWGGEERVYAAIKFVIYTLVGSLLMLVGDPLARVRGRRRGQQRRVHDRLVHADAVRRCRSGRSAACSACSRWRSRSRSRCSRSTRGCPTPTRRRRRAAPSCWPACS